MKPRPAFEPIVAPPTMSEYPPYVVFRHLWPFFRGLGFAPSAKVAPPPGEAAGDGPEGVGGAGGALDAHKKVRDTFITEIEHFGYYRIEAADPAGQVIVVFILSPRSVYASRSPKLRSLLAGLDSEPAAKTGRLAEVIVVLEEKGLERKNIVDVVAEFRARSPELHRDPPPRNPRYNMYGYEVFALDLPKARCVAPHRVLPAAEAREHLRRERLQPGSLKTLPDTDPPVIWAGARPGQILETKAPCETSGYVYDHWLIRPGTLGPFKM